MDILLSIIIGTVTYLAFGYFVFEVVLGKFTKENTLQLKGFNKSDKDTSTPFLILSCAAYAALITFVLYNWQSQHEAIDAFIISGIIGLLVAVMANTFWYSTTYLYKNLQPLIADVAAAFVTVGVMGMVISFIL